MKKFCLISVFSIFVFTIVFAETPWSERMANAVILNNPTKYDNGSRGWYYVNGTTMSGFQALYNATQNPVYLNYIKATTKAQMSGFSSATKTLDNIKEGTAVLFMYEHAASASDSASYKAVADNIRTLLATAGSGISRTSEGGLWHKDPGYAWQMWGDGLYMAQPFYAQYTTLFSSSQTTYFDDIANQFILFEQHARDANTGLLYHGWSEQPTNIYSTAWANTTTGCSPSFWGRAMGWYIMGLVDVLDYFPKNHPKYNDLIAILQRLVPALVTYQDANTGCWYDVVDQASRCSSVYPYTCNYLESSATCMITYGILKAVRLGYVSDSYLAAGKRAYEGILANFMSISAVAGGENILITNNCQVAGLGGNTNRSGTFDYYMSEPIVSSDVDGKPIGPFILASLEYEALPTTSVTSTLSDDSQFRIYSIKDKQLKVELQLKNDARVELAIFDITGKKQQLIIDEFITAGKHEKLFEVANSFSRTCIVRLKTATEIVSQKIFIH